MLYITGIVVYGVSAVTDMQIQNSGGVWENLDVIDKSLIGTIVTYRYYY